MNFFLKKQENLLFNPRTQLIIYKIKDIFVNVYLISKVKRI